MSDQLPLHVSDTTSLTDKPPLPPSTPPKPDNTLVRDSIIGFSDGLTVPFALTAGLSSLGSSKIVVLGGLAELFSGSISMGLGAYLASTQDAKQYELEMVRQGREVRERPAEEEEGVYAMFERFGVGRGEAKGVVEGLKADEEAWVRFLMEFELKLENPSTRYAMLEGVVMGLSYFFGGLLPMIPYFILKHDVLRALFISIGITVVVLSLFGVVRSRIIGGGLKDQAYSAVMTLLLGSVAAGASYGVVYGVNRSSAF